MRSKSKPIGDQKQLNLFDSVDQASCNPPSMANSPDTQHEIGATERQPSVKAYANPNKHSIRRKMLSYKEWRSIAVEYMRDYWHVEIKEAMED